MKKAALCVRGRGERVTVLLEERQRKRMMEYSVSDSRNNELSLIHSFSRPIFFLSLLFTHSAIIKSTSPLSDPLGSVQFIKK